MDFFLRAGNFSTSAVNMLHQPSDWGKPPLNLGGFGARRGAGGHIQM